MATIPNLVPHTDSGSAADKYLFGKMDTFVCSIFFLYVLLLTVLGVAKG